MGFLGRLFFQIKYFRFIFLHPQILCLSTPNPCPSMQPVLTVPHFDIEELFEYVDLYHGSFAVCFKKSEVEQRRLARRGAAEEERLMQRLSTHVTDESNQGLWSMVSSLIPKSALNRTVREVVSGFRYMHCEPVFYLTGKGLQHFGEDSMLAVMARDQVPVHIRPRKFKDTYDWLSVRADCNELRAIVAHCWAVQGARFQYNAMSKCLTYPGPDTRTSWYCSYLCSTMLEFLDVPEGHLNRPNTLLTDDLYDILSNPMYRPECEYDRPAAHINKVYRENPWRKNTDEADRRGRHPSSKKGIVATV